MSTKKGRYGDPRKRRPMGDLYAAAQPSGASDPRKLGGSMSGPGGPHDRGATVIDATDAILLDYTEVCTIDTVRGGVLGGQAIFMTLDGRINKTTDRVRVGYIFDTDGAAAIITELLALADRFGPEMLDDVTRRLTSLYRDKHVDLAWLRAAIDNAIENASG
ncbi:MAG TPA: hypothetical protein VE326_11395 [Candidatus Binatia bacterium]|nr:hypothetical protein [Candidatus Binatia bacterium]